MTSTQTTNLYDYNTGDFIGSATEEQITASAETETGAIKIDVRTGEVLTAGSWAEQDATRSDMARVVYTA
jgi:hypothetical protein